MAPTPRRTPAYRSFISLFFSFHVHCGEHHQDTIAETASQIPDLYPEYRGEGDGSGLSPINIYKMFRGHHGRLPTSHQLSVLVLALQHLAHREHVQNHDPGCDTLPGWQALLSQAKMLDRHQKAESRSGFDAILDVDRPLRFPAPDPATTSPADASPPGARIAVPTIEVTPIEAHELVALGRYPRMLALRASNADYRAYYEIAAILGTAAAPYNQRAAMFAVTAAAAAPAPSPASSLLNSDMTLNAERAAVHARVLAYATGDSDAARVFTYCADRAENLALRTRPPRLRD
ncbi:hypothetical protein OHR68_35575 [Spirillospora sp. NBC_00431]